MEYFLRLKNLWKVLILDFLNQPLDKLAADIRAIAQGVLAASILSPIAAVIYWSSGKWADGFWSLASTPLILIAGLSLHALARNIEKTNKRK